MGGTCKECGRKVKPYMNYCYEHYHKKKGNYNPKKLSKYHGGKK